MELKTLIRQYRESHELSMQQFADMCHLSKSYISMLEKGRHPQNKRLLVPSLETFRKLSDGMHIPLEQLFAIIDATDWIENGFDSDSGSAFPLGPDEVQLIEDYRDASEDVRNTVTSLLHLSAEIRRKGIFPQSPSSD